MSESERVIILGAGQAGGQAAMSLRQMGYAGEIVLIGDEPAPPYQRPPLSKDYLKGKMERERLFLKPESFYSEQSITLRTSVSATAIDRDGKTVTLSTGETLDYSYLIIATGARPRQLPARGGTLKNVLDLRTLADIDDLKPLVTPGQRAVIIGAGFIGLEAAAAMRQMGLDVAVIELADRVLARVTFPVMSDFYQTLHTSHGVKLILGSGVQEISGNEAVTGVVLGNGDTLAADFVLVGIGVLPNLEIAKDAGIACGNGILVDRDALTSDPSVYAIGDCAHRPLVHYDRDGRLESVHNAIEQGKIAAAHICGKPRPIEDVPWFWSDQYDAKLQIAGLSTDADTIVTRGDPASGRFAVFYFRDKALIAVDAVNSPPEFLTAKRLISSGVAVSPEEVADLSVSMKDLMARASAG